MAKSPISTPTAPAAAAVPPVPDAQVFPMQQQPAAAVPPIDASGETTPSPLLDAGNAMLSAMARAQDQLSPPLPGARAMPMPAVQPVGTKGAALAEKPVLDPGFDRRFSIEALLAHPMAEVRQRAEEAQVAIHHGAADMGIKVKAAIDVARGVESRR